MSRIKKITAVFLSMVMFVCCFTVSAAAESIEDTAKAISSGKSYSTQIVEKHGNADFKIKASKAGELVVKFTAQLEVTKLHVYDADGNEILLAEKNIITGDYNRYYDYMCYWNKTTEKYSGEHKFSIKKGTYYIRFTRDDGWDQGGNGKISFTATFPTETEKKSNLNYFQITMKKGTSIQLGALGTVASGDALTWSTNKSSVATVSSKGLITAKAVGTATITAKAGSSTIKIQIKVTS